MHPEAHQAVRRAVRELRLLRQPQRVLDVGGRDVNGHVRDLFHPASAWTSLDALDGPGVDIVADIVTWKPPDLWDVVISTETLEHVHGWPRAVVAMAKAVRPGGAMILTAATDPRRPHSAIDGCALRRGEWYDNVPPRLLTDVLIQEGITDRLHVEWSDIPDHGGDVYAWGRKTANIPG